VTTQSRSRSYASNAVVLMHSGLRLLNIGKLYSIVREDERRYPCLQIPVSAVFAYMYFLTPAAPLA